MVLGGSGAAWSMGGPDEREMVKLPPMMASHMLGNMRDHLVALDEILAALAEGNVGEAGRVAEGRLGMSSLELHGAHHMAPYYPEGMKAVGTAMHRAASRFVTAAEDAEVEGSPESQKKVFGALAEITQACNGCHANYRVR